MVRKIVEFANECGLTGMKRVGFYIVAPFCYVIGTAYGWVLGFIEGFREGFEHGSTKKF